MKRKGLIFFLIILGLLVVSNDSFLEKVGLKTPAAGPLTGEEMMAINHELAAAGLTPPLLQRVTLEKIPDAEPMHDTRLVFSFDRPLTDEENRGFGTREIFKEPWHYSIAVRGRHELAEFRPIHTQSIRQYGDRRSGVRVAPSHRLQSSARRRNVAGMASLSFLIPHVPGA